MEFTDVLKLRRTTRKYAEGQISKDELDRVLYAGYGAPIGKALYENYHFTVIQNKALIEKIGTTVGPDMYYPIDDPFYNAPTIVIISAIKDEASKNIICANVACIIEQMHLAATDIGLGSVYLWGFVAPFNTRQEFVRAAGIPEGFEAVSGIALGYAAKKPVAREIPRDRFTINYVD